MALPRRRRRILTHTTHHNPRRHGEHDGTNEQSARNNWTQSACNHGAPPRGVNSAFTQHHGFEPRGSSAAGTHPQLVIRITRNDSARKPVDHLSSDGHEADKPVAILLQLIRAQKMSASHRKRSAAVVDNSCPVSLTCEVGHLLIPCVRDDARMCARRELRP